MSARCCLLSRWPTLASPVRVGRAEHGLLWLGLDEGETGVLYAAVGDTFTPGVPGGLARFMSSDEQGTGAVGIWLTAPEHELAVTARLADGLRRMTMDECRIPPGMEGAMNAALGPGYERFVSAMVARGADWTPKPGVVWF